MPYITNGIGVSEFNFLIGSGHPTLTWILTTGFWVDEGVWDDSDVWID